MRQPNFSALSYNRWDLPPLELGNRTGVDVFAAWCDGFIGGLIEVFSEIPDINRTLLVGIGESVIALQFRDHHGLGHFFAIHEDALITGLGINMIQSEAWRIDGHTVEHEANAAGVVNAVVGSGHTDITGREGDHAHAIACIDRRILKAKP